MSEKPVPMAGDAVRVVCDSRSGSYWQKLEGKIGIIDGAVGVPIVEELCVIDASAFRDDCYVSCSGGPCPWITPEMLVYAGTYEASFWRWRDYARAGGARHYQLTVNLWEWIPSESR